MSELIQPFMEKLSSLHLERCLIMHQIPSLGIFSTRPTGDDLKGPPKIVVASVIEKGPDMQPALHSATSSASIISGWRLENTRLGGVKVSGRVVGLPVGELYLMSCTRLGKKIPNQPQRELCAKQLPCMG